MRTASLALPCLLIASLAFPAAAEEFDRVVAGLNYRVTGNGGAGLVQAVRVRRDTAQVLVRHPNARTEWVDAVRLVAQPQQVATDGGPYLFVAAALACLLDPHGCVRPPARAADVAAPAPSRGELTRARAPVPGVGVR